MMMTSAQAVEGWSHPVRMLWIDGDHRYDAVKLDFSLWEPHPVEGGILAMHDTIRKQGPKRVLWEDIFRSNRFDQIAIADNITAVRKVKGKTVSSKMRDCSVLALRGIYIAARKSRVPYSKPFGRWLLRTITAKD
jgi:Methyltransferase domain